MIRPDEDWYDDFDDDDGFFIPFLALEAANDKELASKKDKFKGGLQQNMRIFGETKVARDTTDFILFEKTPHRSSQTFTDNKTFKDDKNIHLRHWFHST